MGIPFQSSPDVSFVITSLIHNEIEHIKKHINGLETLISAGRVSIINPSRELCIKLKKLNNSLEVSKLSDADLSLIALGKELKYPIISSDYTLANLAKKLNLEVLIPGKGKFIIKSLKYYCSICKSFTDIAALYCNTCGNKLVLKRSK
jgi:UPF0271 protein